MDNSHYESVAAAITSVLDQFQGAGFHPRIEVIDGPLITLNRDAYDLAQVKGLIHDLFYSGREYSVGRDSYYLKPLEGHRAYELVAATPAT